MEILRVNNLSKKYGKGENEFLALKNINFSINKGEFVCITGKSGCGKSTLIHLLAGLDKPSSGEVIINNQNIYKLSLDDLTIFRRKNIGIIYQFYNLIPNLNVKENILLPLFLDKRTISEKRFNNLISVLGINSKLKSMPNDLSGGLQQRVAIGRALINKPKILFADEPTGNLDSKNSMKVMRLLEFYNKKFKQTIVMVTHDDLLARRCHRNIIMKDGKIINDIRK
ncbi:MAG: ABC transporter ATP-binding protein [Bacilli bacterium]|nr:ABC transporter ATP-binding protein [Bacilli bacterium]